MEKTPLRICMISSIPITLGFFKNLIRGLNQRHTEITLVSSDLPELYQFESELNCEVFTTTISRQISPFRDIVSISRLWNYFRQKKIDIVHAHTPKGGLIGMISSWLARIPNRVYTVHGLVLETAKGLRRGVLWLAEWLSCKLATQVLAVSPSLRQCVINEGICPAEKISVLGSGSVCGIDLKEFSRNESFVFAGAKIRAEYHIPDDAIVIGFLGRLVFDKGIKTLVKAFEKLQQKVSKSYLLLVGNFETVRDSLDDETVQKIKDNAHIVYNNEFVSDVLPFYAAMDIVTLPSRREGFGLTLIEAAALELPTVGTKVTGCVDAVVDGVTGLLVEVDNSEELYQGMLKLAQDSELRKKLGRQGRERVEAIFDSKMMIDRYINLYEKLTGRITNESFIL